jgi:hypothetical protein
MATVNRPTKRTTEEILAAADARIAKSRQAKMERSDKAQSAVTSSTDSKQIIKSAVDLRKQERTATATTGTRPKWSAEDVRADVNHIRLPKTSEKTAETAPFPLIQKRPAENPIENAGSATKRARLSLIPRPNRLRPQFVSRAIAVAA